MTLKPPDRSAGGESSRASELAGAVAGLSGVPRDAAAQTRLGVFAARRGLIGQQRLVEALAVWNRAPDRFLGDVMAERQGWSPERYAELLREFVEEETAAGRASRLASRSGNAPPSSPGIAAGGGFADNLDNHNDLGADAGTLGGFESEDEPFADEEAFARLFEAGDGPEDDASEPPPLLPDWEDTITPPGEPTLSRAESADSPSDLSDAGTVRTLRDAEGTLASASRATRLDGPSESPTEAIPSAGLGRGASRGDRDHPARGASSRRSESNRFEQRFQILRSHARGGLGEVYLAKDRELGREVALKQILDRHAHDPRVRSRFLIEAEITGNLEHPGIVPVYGLGRHADGRPYYAMRFIQGTSLRAAIKEFHAGGGFRGRVERSLELRKLLSRFIEVCYTMAYAHSRCVIHRDLKPSNIMLGRFGETLVVDWGLAKPLKGPDSDSDSRVVDAPPSEAGSGPRDATAVEAGAGAGSNRAAAPNASTSPRGTSPDPAPSTDPSSGGGSKTGSGSGSGSGSSSGSGSGFGVGSSEGPLALRSVDSLWDTVDGSTLGTPEYMSPEQARGDATVGVATDIHGLGATLYALLTNRAPAQGRNLGEGLANTKAGRFPPPRSIEPRAPRGVEAICLKAMAFEPVDRYESAQALADDLERWLADEPILAWREPIHHRARRWARRHRFSVMLIGLAGMILACAMTLVSLVQARANSELSAAADAERAARERASRRLESALTAMDRINDFTLNKIFENPMYRDVREDLLDGTLAFYQELLDDLESDPDPSERELDRLAAAYFRRGTLSFGMGETRDAENALRKAVNLYDRLLAADPSNPRNRLTLARARFSLGYLRRDAPAGRGEALREFEAAARLLADLRDATTRPRVPARSAALPDNLDVAALTVDCMKEIANVRLAMDRPEEAERSFLEARGVAMAALSIDPAAEDLEQALARVPARAVELLVGLVTVKHDLAMLYQRTYRYHNALLELEPIEPMIQAIGQIRGDAPVFERLRVITQFEVARLKTLLGEDADAEALYARDRDAFLYFLNAPRGRLYFPEAFVEGLLGLSQFHEYRREHAVAREYAERAALLARLLADRDRDHRHANLAATAYAAAGLLAAHLGDEAAARRHGAEVLALARDVPEELRDLQFRIVMAHARALAGDPAGALDDAEALAGSAIANNLLLGHEIAALASLVAERAAATAAADAADEPDQPRPGDELVRRAETLCFDTLDALLRASFYQNHVHRRMARVDHRFDHVRERPELRDVFAEQLSTLSMPTPKLPAPSPNSRERP